MKAVLLIAANYLRQQRFYIAALLLWVFGSAALMALPSSPPEPEDTLFYVRQQAGYAAVLSLFVAVGAVYNERRSRRILAVLSKAVGRGRYLAGLLCGVVGLALIDVVGVGLAGSWMAHRVGWPAAPLWIFVAVLLAACALLAVWAMFLSTFMHPLFAAGAAGVALAAQLAVEWTVGLHSGPLLGLLRGLTMFRFQASWEPPLLAVCLALLEAALLWAAAVRIFAGRDVTVAIE